MINYRGHRYFGRNFERKEEKHYELGVVGIAAIAVTVAAAGLSTYAAVKSSENQAALAKAVQKQKETEAQNVAETAAFEERQTRRRTALLIGKQTAIQAASGVDITSGTPLIQDIDLTTQAELEALNVRRSGKIAADESIFESRIAKYQADTAKGQIPYEIAGGVLSATGSALSTYGSYYGYGNTKRTTTSEWSGYQGGTRRGPR